LSLFCKKMTVNVVYTPKARRSKNYKDKTSVAEPHHMDAAPVLLLNFDAAPAPFLLLTINQAYFFKTSRS
jgi:hypothetical protein